jgi:squalene-hopene/tetraprenyl-beta-curcumene cyclase
LASSADPNISLNEFSDSGLDSSIEQARDCLLSQFQWQDPATGKDSTEGFWCGELEADSTLESDYILFLHLFDKEKYRDKIARLASVVARHQLEDGSWNIYEGGRGEISATVKAYVALKIAGYREDDPAMVRTREAIRVLGGADGVNSYTKVYLAMLNLRSWDQVPAIPPEVVLLPRFFYINIYEISYWSRAILIPLSILYAKWADFSTPSGLSIEELFDDGETAAGGNGNNAVAGKASPGGGAGNGPGVNPNGQRHKGIRRYTESIFSWRSVFTTIDLVLKKLEKTRVKPLRKLAVKKAEDWIITRLEDSDGLGAIFPSMINSVLALRCLGYDSDHPLVLEGMEKLEELEIEEGEEIHLQPCLSPVWDTALALNAIGESRVAEGPYSSSEGEKMSAAGTWLLSKEVRRAGDWQKRVRNAEVSGWPFQFRNEFYPDIDDTAAVVMALNRVGPGVAGLEEAVSRGISWVLSLQCSNGGWAAFDANVERKILNEIPYADHNAMLDPACADITGRVLEMLGSTQGCLESAKAKAAVRCAVEYLEDSQEENGSWYGRWGVNYIYGTWQALKGLSAVGVGPDEDIIRRAATYLKARQNTDGGWGESCESYEDPALSGVGETTPSQTAWAVMGLIAAGEQDSVEVERGARFLVETQAEDGDWHEKYWTGTGFPRVFYLKYHMYSLYFPLFALSMYRNSRRRDEVGAGAAPQGTLESFPAQQD